MFSLRGCGGRRTRRDVASLGEALHLPVFELDRRKSTENGNRDLQLTTVWIDLVDSAGERRKGTIGNFDFFTNEVLDFRNFLTVGRLDARTNFVDFGLTKSGRTITADEADHASDFLHKIPRFVDHLLVLAVEAHLDEDVARVKFANFGGFCRSSPPKRLQSEGELRK